jgi:hypothetical protein
MRPILCVLSVLLFTAPAMAQTAPRSAPASIQQLIAAPGISAGHALALGAGLFAGAVLGSAVIQGGPLAAVIGGVAGLAAGNWIWIRHGDELD